MPIRSQHSAERIAISRVGAAKPLLVQNAAADARPFLHPILAPDGDGELTENEPPHHPWQHGLYTGLNDVNGYGFWTESLTRNSQDGSFHPLPLAAPIVEEERVAWKVVAQWKAPGGALLLTEAQHWKWEDRGGTFVLDLCWELQAATDLRFGSSSYGGLFLRMPWRRETGGAVLSSEGAGSQAEAEGRRARWMALSMPLPKCAAGCAGLAMLDHPGNAEHPSTWRVDDNMGIAPSRSIAGAWHLDQAETVSSRYRLLALFGLALTLCGLRRIPQSHHEIISSHQAWQHSPPDGIGRPSSRGIQFSDDARFANGTVQGKRVRVVGAGNIASRYASFCSMMGADVAAWDPFASEPCFHRAGARREYFLERLVQDAEIFAPMLPLNNSTLGIVSAAHIEALPVGCLVVLVTRAEICDTAALRARVLHDELSLAADVFDIEPLPLDDPLLGRHNVVHTPHSAGRTMHANHSYAQALLDQFEPVERASSSQKHGDRVEIAVD